MSDEFVTKSKEVKRDSWGRYRLYDPEDPKKKVKSWTRTTTFAKAVDDQSNLQKWLMRMVAKGVASDEALTVEIASTDMDNRFKLDKLTEKAKDRAGANDAANNGTAIHSLTEAYDNGEVPTVPAKWKRHLKNYVQMRDRSGLEMIPEYIERVIVLPEMGVAGTFDRLCRVKKDMTVTVNGKPYHLRKGEYVIGDVKSNKSLDFAQLSISVQLSIYAHAKYVFDTDTEEYHPLPEINTDVGFIFHIPSDSGEAELYAIDLKRGWEAANLCKNVREFRKLRDLVEVVDLDGNPFESDLDTDWEGRIRNASTRAELSAVRKEANSVGEWTDELLKLGLERLEAL